MYGLHCSPPFAPLKQLHSQEPAQSVDFLPAQAFGGTLPSSSQELIDMRRCLRLQLGLTRQPPTQFHSGDLSVMVQVEYERDRQGLPPHS